MCKNWANRFCEDIEAGGGQLADCLAQHQAAADSGESRTGEWPIPQCPTVKESGNTYACQGAAAAAALACLAGMTAWVCAYAVVCVSAVVECATKRVVRG